MLFRPNGKYVGPRIIPEIGVLKYKMHLFQMDNDEVESECRLCGYGAAHREAAQKEWNYRQYERMAR